jgi:hypothetical protein
VDRPVVSDLTEEFYAALGWWAKEDENLGQVVPPYTNMSTNPSLEVDLTGYNTTLSYWINDTAVLTRDTSLPAVAGEAMGKVVAPGTKTLEGMKSRAIAGGLELTAGQAVTVSVAVRGAVGGELVKLGVGDATNGHAESAYVALTTKPQRLAVTLTPTGSGLSNWALVGPNALVAQTFYWDAAQIVDGTEALGYIDGDMPGCEWLGTPGASASGYLGKDTTWPLLRTAAAWVETLLDPVYEVVRERDGQRGWAVLLDPANCPAKGLPYLAQYVGAELTPEMDEAQQRAEIEEPTSWKRGQLPAIKLVGARGLTGTKRVIVRSRTPSVGHHYIRTLASETPSPERTEFTLRKKGVPAWEMLDYEAIDGVTVEDVAAGWKTVADLAAAFSSVEDLADILPNELPEP